jgi:hypothetical protein
MHNLSKNGQWFLIKLNIWSRCQMIFNQTEHLAKMANDLYIKWPMVFNQVEH